MSEESELRSRKQEDKPIATTPQILTRRKEDVSYFRKMGVWTLFSAFLLAACLSSGLSDDPEMRYSVLIDAGSAGTRIFVYSFQAPAPLESLSEVVSKKVNKGDQVLSYRL
jgi:hypothetical protein